MEKAGGQDQMHRPRTARGRQSDRMAQKFGDLCRIDAGGGVFANGCEHRFLIGRSRPAGGLLMRSTPGAAQLNLTGEREDGRALDRRDGKAGKKVRRARSQSGQANSELAGRAGIGEGGVGCTLLVLGQDELDAGMLVDRVAQVQNRAPGTPSVDAFGRENIEEGVSLEHLAKVEGIPPEQPFSQFRSRKLAVRRALQRFLAVQRLRHLQAASAVSARRISSRHLSRDSRSASAVSTINVAVSVLVSAE